MNKKVSELIESDIVTLDDYIDIYDENARRAFRNLAKLSRLATEYMVIMEYDEFEYPNEHKEI